MSEVRAIDANALKVAVNSAWLTGHDKLQFNKLIDSAPTVVAKSATTERPKGEWIDSGVTADGFQVFRCSECGRQVATFEALLYRYPFCHCGAEMKGGKDAT